LLATRANARATHGAKLSAGEVLGQFIAAYRQANLYSEKEQNKNNFSLTAPFAIFTRQYPAIPGCSISTPRARDPWPISQRRSPADRIPRQDRRGT